MIDLVFDFPKPQAVRDRLAAGYRARRNFLVYQLFSYIVMGTPVLSGRARGGWQISVRSPSTSSPIRLDPDGTNTIGEEIANLKGAGAFLDIFIVNNIAYIDELERGTSQQAPDGMVKVAMSAFRAMNRDVE